MITADIEALLIDDGGVMNDNIPRSAEWRRLVGEFFSSELCGEKAAWSEANRAVFAGLEPMLLAGPQDSGYSDWVNDYQLRWLRGMARIVGVPAPTGDEECLDLAWRASDYITPRVRSAFPGAIEAVRTLRSMGFRLFTASGEHSRELDGYLTGMGVRQLFATLYGSDLIETGKYSAQYYRRLFDHAGILPGKAMVIDDKPQYLEWAAGLGAATCLVSVSPHPETKATMLVPSLAGLPAALKRLMNPGG